MTLPIILFSASPRLRGELFFFSVADQPGSGAGKASVISRFSVSM